MISTSTSLTNMSGIVGFVFVVILFVGFMQQRPARLFESKTKTGRFFCLFLAIGALLCFFGSGIGSTINVCVMICSVAEGHLMRLI